MLFVRASNAHQSLQLLSQSRASLINFRIKLLCFYGLCRKLAHALFLSIYITLTRSLSLVFPLCISLSALHKTNRIHLGARCDSQCTYTSARLGFSTTSSLRLCAPCCPPCTSCVCVCVRVSISRMFAIVSALRCVDYQQQL